MSAEFGWRYALNDMFFIEPQTQLQIIRIEGDQFETDGGIKAQIADTNSIIGRIGLRAGSTFTLGSAEQKARRMSSLTHSASSRAIMPSLPQAIRQRATSAIPAKRLGMTQVLAPMWP